MNPSRASLSRKRSSVVASLPPSVAWLEPLVLSMTIVGAKASTVVAIGPHLVRHSALHYRLLLQPRAGAEWSLSRSFDDYRAFQKRLLKLMDHGHFCAAECPWLYTFVKSYIPKKSFFDHSASARVAARRRDGLLRCFAALQTFLLSRANHVCAVVVDSVATELLRFVLQDAAQDHPVQHQRAFDSAGWCSSDSFALTSDDEDTTSSTDLESSVCALCDSSLDAEPHSNTGSSRGGDDAAEHALRTSLVGAASSSGSGAGAGYTTTLSCGHQFHDECIVQKLNDAMQCPTCGAAQASH
ncbi:hypothetical protein PybrP1_006156 [[Pythium] brassicae (nom. inval.)]|nr:hypothetical protein PybrP1_006156 [[Pythium] brassicae (nom. inval.)]